MLPADHQRQRWVAFMVSSLPPQPPALTDTLAWKGTIYRTWTFPYTQTCAFWAIWIEWHTARHGQPFWYWGHERSVWHHVASLEPTQEQTTCTFDTCDVMCTHRDTNHRDPFTTKTSVGGTRQVTTTWYKFEVSWKWGSSHFPAHSTAGA